MGCIVYRIPRGISISDPARSFCPHCHETLSWRENIPIISWLWLKGRCRHCKTSISIQYPLIEAVTGGLFVWSSWQYGFPETVPLWLFLAMLVSATWIDLEFYIIPDRLTVPAIFLGFLTSLSFPELQLANSRLQSGLISFIGILTGGGLLYLISELGKLAFGRYKFSPNSPLPFHLEQTEQKETVFKLEEETHLWSDFFFRKSDRIRIQATEISINGDRIDDGELILFSNRIITERGTFSLDEIHHLQGKMKEAIFPREAMGLGDVKLLAAIGAYTGWKGVLFTIPVASFLGAIVGIGLLVIKRREWSSRIPFGPYLAAGAILWLFFGQAIVAWYAGI